MPRQREIIRQWVERIPYVLQPFTTQNMVTITGLPYRRVCESFAELVEQGRLVRESEGDYWRKQGHPDYFYTADYETPPENDENSPHYVPEAPFLVIMEEEEIRKWVDSTLKTVEPAGFERFR